MTKCYRAYMFKTVTIGIRLFILIKSGSPLFKFVVKVLKKLVREAITSNTERVIPYTIRVGSSDTRE